MRRSPLRWVWWRVGLALFCVAGVLLGASQAFGARVMNDVLMGAFHVILWSIVLGVLARTWPRRTPPISRIVGGAVGAAATAVTSATAAGVTAAQTTAAAVAEAAAAKARRWRWPWGKPET